MEMAKITLKPFAVLFLLLGTFLMGLSANGQAGTEPPQIVKVEERHEDKIVLEFTHDTWLDAPDGVDLQTPSLGFKAYLFSDYTFGKSDLSFAWGIGVSVDNVRSNAVFVQDVSADGEVGPQTLIPFEEGYEWERNKFVTTYLELPIEFRYIKSGRNPFKLALGLRAGVMLSNHQKIIDTEGKRKFYDFDDINRFRYGLSARLGVGKIQLTGFYSLVPLIETNKGTDVIPISLGLAFTFIK
jgi:hypothetical protein